MRKRVNIVSTEKDVSGPTVDPIKLLLSTDSAAIHTGLAETTRLVFKRLLDRFPGKYEISQLGWFHLPEGGETVPWEIYATEVKDKGFVQEDKYGQRTFENILHKVKPDIVYTNGDLWCFDHLLNSPSRNLFRLVTYYTIDGQPYWGNEIIPGKKSEWGNTLSKADKIVVLTEFGEEVLKNSMPEMAGRDISVIYHPVDEGRFRMLNDTEKALARQDLWAPGVPQDAFVLGWVGRNQYRKQNYLMWELMYYLVHGDYIQCKDCGRVTRREYDHCAMKTREVGRLRSYEQDYDYSYCWYCRSKDITEGESIDDIYLWTHMNKSDPGWKCDINTTMWKVKDRVIYTNGLTPARGIPPQQLANLIATWDVMLYLSGGEGFGIPAYESMISGVPVIYSNYSSHADFCQHGGLPVRCSFVPELNFTIERAVADINHAIEVVLWAYNNRVALKELGKKGRAWTEDKTLDSIVDQWDEVFTNMMKNQTGIDSTSLIYAQTV